MKLDELKKMIAEEFESYMKEDDVDVSVGADDVDAEMGDEMGDEMEQNPEEALEKIYQMLQAYFEKDGEDNDMDGVEDEPGEEPMEEIAEEELLALEQDSKVREEKEIYLWIFINDEFCYVRNYYRLVTSLVNKRFRSSSFLRGFSNYVF